MIIQTAPKGELRLAIMMYEHTALAHQFARAFGNDQFEPLSPGDPMHFIVLHHDAGWADFDADPATDANTGLPYNLIDTPAEYITVTSRLSPEFNERQHPYSGLISSMHSWGLYNGRYGMSKMVLIDNIPLEKRPLAEAMLSDELARQKRLKQAVSIEPAMAGWLDDQHIFQNYKQLQFVDTLALYFNRVHASERKEATFEHVPANSSEDVNITVRPCGVGVYAVSPFPFGAEAEFGFAGRLLSPGDHKRAGSWPAVFRSAPTRWETFRLVRG
jgi:hypothetical protein